MSRKHVNSFRGDVYFTPNKQIKDEPSTPVEDEGFGDQNQFDLDCPENFFQSCGTMRKSMSMSDVASIQAVMKEEHDLNDVSYQQRHLSGHLDLEYSRKKFVSMAEAVYHFQRDTPSRFHTTRPQRFHSSGTVGRMPLTKPQSPVLRCKTRTRNLHVMSQQEKEELELEEIRKHKIKPQPIPKSVIEGKIHLPEVPRKPNTVPEPFNLTEMHKKLIESPEQATNFRARPAPRHILEKPFVPVKPLLRITEPVSPNFHYKKPPNDKHKSTYADVHEKTDKPQVRTGPVRPEPFSFERRNEDLKKRKEEKIRRQIEEEKKKASEFRAQPVPSAVKKQMTGETAKASTASNTSSDNKENHTKFEAKPPTVLYKEPFKPVLQTHIVKVSPFALASEKRAAERKLYEQQLKEKEEQQERMKQEMEKKLKEQEERAQAKLRAELVHHAKPLPVSEPFVPQKSSMPLTIPETPKFVRKLNQRSKH